LSEIEAKPWALLGVARDWLRQYLSTASASTVDRSPALCRARNAGPRTVRRQRERLLREKTTELTSGLDRPHRRADWSLYRRSLSIWRPPCLSNMQTKERHTPQAERDPLLAVATTLAAGAPPAAPDRRPPSCGRPAGSSSRSCAGQPRSWSSAWLLPGRGRPGGGWPCSFALAGLPQQLAAARLLRLARRLQSAMRRWRPLLQGHSHLERNGGRLLAVKRGGRSQLSGLGFADTRLLWQHGVIDTPGGDRPGKSRCAVGKARSGRPSNGCGPNSVP